MGYASSEFAERSHFLGLDQLSLCILEVVVCLFYFFGLGEFVCTVALPFLLDHSGTQRAMNGKAEYDEAQCVQGIRPPCTIPGWGDDDGQIFLIEGTISAVDCLDAQIVFSRWDIEIVYLAVRACHPPFRIIIFQFVVYRFRYVSSIIDTCKTEGKYILVMGKMNFSGVANHFGQDVSRCRFNQLAF